MTDPRFAMILYTVREPAKEDVVATLKRVREIGFEYVQWSGMPVMPADEIRKALDAADLQAIACHTSMEPFEEDFDAQVAFWKTVGVPDVAPGGMMNDCRDTLDDWMNGVRRLDAIGAKLYEQGIRLSYHNHDFEFEKFDGDERCKLDILYGETGVNNLRAELDLGWCYVGGVDPAAYLRTYAGRCPVVHAKDIKKEYKEGESRFADLGQGALDWASIFEAGRESDVEWFVYEQDTTDGDVWDSVEASYAFLKSNLG
ncbi:MAG: sugar phosphate isomerase/epimerase [bacterium]|nr:sugar phosphate isomerase/epimerase [bacterium]